MGFWSISPQPQGVSDEGLIFETSEDVEVLPTFDALLGVEPVGWLVGWLVMNEGAINLPGLVMVLWTKP